MTIIVYLLTTSGERRSKSFLININFRYRTYFLISILKLDAIWEIANKDAFSLYYIKLWAT